MSHDNEAPGTSPAPGEVRLERWLPGPPERVWAYLTESEKRGTWLAPGEMELRVGGRVEHRFRHADLSHEKTPPPPYEAYEAGHVMIGTITRCEPPRLLAYTWGGGDDESEVTFQLVPQPGGEVLLVVTQRRLRSVTGMANVAAGWHAHLGILLDRLEGRPPRGFWSAHARHEAEYTRRLTGAEPAPRAEPAPSPSDPALP
ncbi:MAG TPA: SRPBCC family protein [Longimicrobiaceae bacterium]|nr:SRPBCC family protein [Longimicrobiaceae bacterium]